MKRRVFQKNDERRTLSSLIMKTFMLLAFMLSGVSGALADNLDSSVTLVSSDDGTQASNSLASSELYGIASGSDVSFSVDGTSQNFFKFNGDDAYVKMYFANGSSVWRYMPGDVLSVIVGTTDNNRTVGFKLKSSDRSSAAEETISNTYTTLTHTLTADDINDDGSISILRSGQSWACRYYKFTVTCQRWGTDISVLTNNADYGTASFKVNSVTGNSNVSLNTDVVSASVGQPANVTFTATPASGKLFWRWEYADGSDPTYSATETVNVTSSQTRTAIFVDGIHVRAISNDESIGTVNITYGSTSGTDIHATPWPGTMTFTATPTGSNTFQAWYSDAACTQQVSTDASYTATNIAGSDYTLYAKFIKNTTYARKFGNTDYSTPFGGARSAEFTINKGELVNGNQTGHMRTFKFKCHGKPNGTIYNNFAIRATKSSTAQNEIFSMNTVPQVWASGACTDSKMYVSQDGSLTEFTRAVNEGAFIQDMENADVTVKVSFTGTTIYVYAVMKANGRTYVYPYTHTIDQRDKIYAHITVDNSYITDFEVSDEVAAVPTIAYVAYDSSCPDSQKNGGHASGYTLEGFDLTNSSLEAAGYAQNWLVGVGDVLTYKAWPTNRFITWGSNRNTPIREVEVNGSNHITDGIVKPTATFGGYETISFSMTPNPYYTYVGATNIGRADINGLPGVGWSHLTAWTTGDSQIASLSNNEWVLGGKAGKVTATIKMAECRDEATDEAYNEAQASYDLIVKPGRVSGSTAKYSVDFTQYLNESEIQAAFGGYSTSSDLTAGYLKNINISNDPSVSLIVNAEAMNGTGSRTDNSDPSIRLVSGGNIAISTPGTFTSVKIAVGARGDQKIRYYLDGDRTPRVAEAVNGIVTIEGISSSTIRFIQPADGNKVTFVKSIDAEYTAEPGFSETSVRYNIADLKKSATEVPQLIAMPNATYTSANPKIVKVNSDGSLVFLKTGRTSIKAEANGVTKSYDIEIYADAAEFEVSNDGAKYTYQVTKAGMLPTNAVASIPGITMTYGSYGETPLVANHANSSSGNGLGIAVIGSASGNEGSIAPIINNKKFTAGTYYLFTPTISGTLSISGYFEGSHSAWFCEYTETSGIANTYEMAMTRDAKALVTGVVTVEGGKTYCLYCPLDENNRVENYFMLNSFSFTASMQLAYQSYLVPNKQNGTFTVDIPNVEGKGSLAVSYEIGRIIKYNEDDFSAYEPAADETKKTWVAAQPDNCKNPASGLSAVIENGQVKITSNGYNDGGAVVVNVKVGSSVLPYVITVPYIGKHVWNFHNMKNKQENRESANWFFDWEVKNGTYIKDPIVLAQEKVQGNNAMMIDQTNGLYITTVGHSKMGLSVIATSNDVESLPRSEENAQTQRSTQIDVVRNVNLVVLRGADVTIPQVKKDWFVKIYLDPHTGNVHKENGIGNGCEFSVTNAKDLRGNLIDPSHVIMSYGTQWTRSTTFDDKTSYYGYAGCLIFRAAEDGDVTFNFKDNGWDKIVKIEVTDTYSTEMELGSTNLDGKGNRTVDYKRWNHSWVHRVGTNGTGNGISYVYDGHPVCHAENAKPIDYTVMYNHGTVNTSVVNGNWTSSGGNVYNKGTFTSNNGVGNVKILSQATYNAYSYDGGWHDTGAKYVLNSSEQWVVVGKITEQQYPKTWDFTNYNMNHGTTTKNIEGQSYSDQTNQTRTWSVGGNTLTCNSDTTYGRWNDHITNIYITKEQAAEMGIYSSPKTDTYDSPFYTIADDAQGGQAGTKTYNIPIAKPLFANGGELTAGFKTIPETEGIGVILDWQNAPNNKTQNVTLDGGKLQVNTYSETGIYDIVIPNVTEGMYVFVKSSNAPTISPLYDAPETGLYAKNAIVSKATLEADAENNFGFEKNNDNQIDGVKGGNVTVFKVTQTGDVVLRFANNTEIYKIGVTNESKVISHFGYSTESRAIDIDYKETKFFSANTQAYYVTNVENWYNRDQNFNIHDYLNLSIDNGRTLEVADEAYIPAGNGIILKNCEFQYDKDDEDTKINETFLIPLFVPACNVPAVEAQVLNSNMLIGSTSKDKATTTISTTTESANEQYYTLSNCYVGVTLEDNTHTTSYYYTSTPRFYRYVGTGGYQQQRTLKNLAYLKLTKGANVKSLCDVVKLDFDDETDIEATNIEIVEIGDKFMNDGVFYNLRGQAINGMPSVPGIYIKNGQKYYVK